jgi:hypothetical protein
MLIVKRYSVTPARCAMAQLLAKPSADAQMGIGHFDRLGDRCTGRDVDSGGWFQPVCCFAQGLKATYWRISANG